MSGPRLQYRTDERARGARERAETYWELHSLPVWRTGGVERGGQRLDPLIVNQTWNSYYIHDSRVSTRPVCPARPRTSFDRSTRSSLCSNANHPERRTFRLDNSLAKKTAVRLFTLETSLPRRPTVGVGRWRCKMQHANYYYNLHVVRFRHVSDKSFETSCLITIALDLELAHVCGGATSSLLRWEDVEV